MQFFELPIDLFGRSVGWFVGLLVGLWKAMQSMWVSVTLEFECPPDETYQRPAVYSSITVVTGRLVGLLA